MSQFGRILEAFGKQLAWFWLGIVALVLLFSFLICGIAASIFVGACAAWLVGYGTFGVIVFFVVAFFSVCSCLCLSGNPCEASHARDD